MESATRHTRETVAVAFAGSAARTAAGADFSPGNGGATHATLAKSKNFTPFAGATRASRSSPVIVYEAPFARLTRTGHSNRHRSPGPGKNVPRGLAPNVAAVGETPPRTAPPRPSDPGPPEGAPPRSAANPGGNAFVTSSTSRTSNASVVLCGSSKSFKAYPTARIVISEPPLSAPRSGTATHRSRARRSGARFDWNPPAPQPGHPGVTSSYSRSNALFDIDVAPERTCTSGGADHTPSPLLTETCAEIGSPSAIRGATHSIFVLETNRARVSCNSGPPSGAPRDAANRTARPAVSSNPTPVIVSTAPPLTCAEGGDKDVSRGAMGARRCLCVSRARALPCAAASKPDAPTPHGARHAAMTASASAAAAREARRPRIAV